MASRVDVSKILLTIIGLMVLLSMGGILVFATSQELHTTQFKKVQVGEGKEIRKEYSASSIVDPPDLPPPVIEFIEKIAALVCQDPDKHYIVEFLTCAKRIGSSLEGRAINVFDIGGGPLRVFFIGGLHTGTEDNTRVLAERILRYFLGEPQEIPENITLYIAPKVNPDGVALGIHNNARNVDLNRNWPASNWRHDPYHPTYGRKSGAGGTHALSEPETKAIFNFVIKVSPAMTFIWHSKANIVVDNNVGIADEAASVYAKAAGYSHIVAWEYYEVTGGFTDAMAEQGIAAADIELATRASEYQRNLKGVKAVLEYISQTSNR